MYHKINRLPCSNNFLPLPFSNGLYACRAYFSILCAIIFEKIYVIIPKIVSTVALKTMR